MAVDWRSVFIRELARGVKEEWQVPLAAVTQLDCGDSEELPELKTGGLCKISHTDSLHFCSSLSVPFTVNGALRNGERTFLFKLSHCTAGLRMASASIHVI